MKLWSEKLRRYIRGRFLTDFIEVIPEKIVGFFFAGIE
jgi:hypothetical protein